MKIIRIYKDIKKDKAYLYKSPVGKLFLYADINDKYLTQLSFEAEKNIIKDENGCPSVVKKTKKELDEYFYGKRKIFTIPLALYGTDFQYAVWTETSKIPFGEILTYSEIAKKVSNSLGSVSRAVGLAESKNPISILIPCHRVVGKNMKLTGYGGGIEKKEYLLKLEGFNIIDSKIAPL